MKYCLLFCVCILGKISNAQVYFDTSNYYYYISDTPLIANTVGNIPFTHSLLIAGPKVRSVKYQTDTSCLIDLETHVNVHKPVGNCYANDKAGLIGRRIAETPDSIIIYNEHFEPLVIRLNAPLFEPYNAFSNDIIYITLEKLEPEEKTVLDTLLLAERYKINVFKKDSTPFVSNSFHEKIIGISKGHGLVFTPNLSSFPYELLVPNNIQLAGITSFEKQINRGYTYYTNPLTLFEVGDEFHVYARYMDVKSQASGYVVYTDSNWVRKIVTNKTLLSSDWISYEYTVEHANRKSERMANMNLPLKDTFSRVTYTATYNLKTKYIPDLVPFEYFDEAMMDAFDWIGFSSSFLVNDDFKVVGFKYDGYSNHFFDSVWCIGFSDHRSRTIEYNGIGIPTIQTYHEYSNYSSGLVSLVYLKKNGKTWGVPYLSSVGLQDTEVPTIKLYPNPANHKLFVESIQPVNSIEIYNVEGKKINTYLNGNTVDTQQLPDGMYLLKIESSDNNVVFKRVAVQH